MVGRADDVGINVSMGEMVVVVVDFFWSVK